MYSLIKKVVCCPGVSGNEKQIAALLEKEVAPYVDETYTDALGNLIAIKYGNLPDGERKKLLYCAHMDEIGFIVTYIEDNGFIRFAPIGGINFVAAAFTHVVFANGEKGILVPESGVKASDLAADKCVVDIGATSAKEASRKVKIGDCFSLAHNLSKLGANRAVGRPIDDRIGCAIMIETAKSLAENCPHDMYYVFSVQEEVGCRGARPAGFSIAPDVAIAFDVTGTGDAQGSKPMAVKLGGGAAIKIKDGSVICSGEVVSKLQKLAKENKITSQNEILLYGGTDTSVLQAAGIGAYAGCISIPSRYIHSGVEMIDLRDVKACTDLSIAFALDPTL
jgi:endoglucanase